MMPRVRSAVALGRRYLHERRDPDRALSVLDLAGAVARRSGGIVDRAAIAAVISRSAQVPIEHLLIDDPERFLNMEHTLAEQVIGQSHVLAAVSETIRETWRASQRSSPSVHSCFSAPPASAKQRQ